MRRRIDRVDIPGPVNGPTLGKAATEKAGDRRILSEICKGLVYCGGVERIRNPEFNAERYENVGFSSWPDHRTNGAVIGMDSSRQFQTAAAGGAKNDYRLV
jgi:hypothetical protein